MHVRLSQPLLTRRYRDIALRPDRAEEALPSIKRKLSAEAFSELVAVAPRFPSWLARSVGKAAYG